ncbi:MAG: hypothetical protein E7359_01865 [Clostridiales bacterium]|nr:hypothetical protein [Clostridiales bacterium]
MDLGKLKIQYTENENIIQIFNSPNVCSLVINGKVVDQYSGLIATRFCLKGEINTSDKKIIVEAKMGFFNMRLFCNGCLVAKKFMGLG